MIESDGTVVKKVSFKNPKARKFFYLAALVVFAIFGGLNFWFELQVDIDSNFVSPNWWQYSLTALSALGVASSSLAIKNLPKTLNDLFDQAFSEEEALSTILTAEAGDSLTVAVAEISPVEAAAAQITAAIVGKVVSDLMIQAHLIEVSEPIVTLENPFSKISREVISLPEELS